MKPNASWEVRVPTVSPVHKSIHDNSPPDAKLTALYNIPLVFTDGPFGDESRQQKGQEGGDDSTLYSSLRGQESCSSLASVGTDSGRDASRKSGRSSRDTSKKKRRRARRRSSVGSTVSIVAFDPTKSATKSCMKRKSEEYVARRQQLQLRRKQEDFFKVYLPGKNFVKRQRTIYFHDGVHVREVRSSLSLCKGERRLLWWQDDEQAAIKENLQRLLARVNNKGVSAKNGRRYCTRGLERFLEGKNDWEADRSEAEQAVFCEQTHQREMGTFDDMRIAAVYFRRTRNSMKRASDRGIEDAIVAQPIRREGKDLRSTASTGTLNASIGMSPPDPKDRRSSLSMLPRRGSIGMSPSNPKERHSSLSMLPRRGSLTFRRKPEERIKKSNSFRQMIQVVSSTA